MIYQTRECYYRVSIKALILDDKDRFLLVKETNNLWELPGGGLDHGETHISCLKRELKEEMGLTITNISAKPAFFLTSVNLNNHPIANIVYIVKVKDLEFTPSDECCEIRFVTSKEALNLRTYPNIQVFAKQFDPKLI